LAKKAGVGKRLARRQRGEAGKKSVHLCHRTSAKVRNYRKVLLKAGTEWHQWEDRMAL
jgi:hypothetical protein